VIVIEKQLPISNDFALPSEVIRNTVAICIGCRIGGLWFFEWQEGFRPHPNKKTRDQISL
jgi:hypothetical protein